MTFLSMAVLNVILRCVPVLSEIQKSSAHTDNKMENDTIVSLVAVAQLCLVSLNV